MDVKKRAEIITKWINDYCSKMDPQPGALVVGISGGVDSSVVSTLCAETGRKTIVLSMPIKQKVDQLPPNCDNTVISGSVERICGGNCEKLISKSSFSLKGGGWYKDGYVKPSKKS